MTNPTSNFGWQMPTSSDLVTDLPADFETFGQAVDTSMADLKGGTTGQVLSKASNTNMDFTWVTTDDANAIQNSIVDAKGDLIGATANDTPARLAVGSDYGFLQALASESTGLKWNNDAWANFATTTTAGSGTITSVTSDMKWVRVGKLLFVRFQSLITNAGTGGNYLQLTLPFTLINSNAQPVGSGREQALTGNMLQVTGVTNANIIRIFTYSNGNPIATNANLVGSFFGEVA